MAQQQRKLTRKEKMELQKSQSQVKHVEQKTVSKSVGLKWMLSLIIAVLAFGLYANTLGHKYVLDDWSVIKENRLTMRGWDAFPEILKRSFRFGYITTQDELYRPLPKATFAVEWAIAPDNPKLPHFDNILLYALTGILLFLTLRKYMKGDLVVPFITAILFIAHPIHTEAVANIKSRDEVMSLFFAMGAMSCIYEWLRKEKLIWMLAAVLSFFLSMCSKESGITFLAVFPLALYFFTDAPIRKHLAVVFTMLIPVIIFVLIRNSVLAGSLKTNFSAVDNLLMAAPNGISKLATAVFILLLYLKVIFFPHPLVIDYSYKQIPIIDMGDWRFWLALAVYAGLFFIALRGLKKKNLFSFAILYFFITVSIFSNILIIIGTSFGERLMLIPSVAFCFVLAVAGVKLFPPAKKIFTDTKEFFSANAKLIGLCSVLVVLYGFKTIERNGDWVDNYTLFAHDVKISDKSAHMHNYFGNLLSKPDQLDRKDSAVVALTYDTAIAELKKAIEIFPEYADCYNQLGLVYYKQKKYKDAYDNYTLAIKYNNTNAVFHNNIGTLFFDTQDYNGALKAIHRAIELDPHYTDALANLGSTYGTLKDYDNALIYLHKCVKEDPNYANAYFFLSITYGYKGDKQNEELYMKKYEAIKGKRTL
jgi:tetratricopeptide (TPR) repeat protein